MGNGKTNNNFKNTLQGTSLAVQWLRLCASNVRGTGLIPGRGTKIPHAGWYGQKVKKNKIKHSSEC